MIAGDDDETPLNACSCPPGWAGGDDCGQGNLGVPAEAVALQHDSRKEAEDDVVWYK